MCSGNTFSESVGHIHADDVASLQQFVASTPPSSSIFGTVERADLAELARSRRAAAVHVTVHFHLMMGTTVINTSPHVPAPLSAVTSNTAPAARSVPPAGAYRSSLDGKLSENACLLVTKKMIFGTIYYRSPGPGLAAWLLFRPRQATLYLLHFAWPHPTLLLATLLLLHSLRATLSLPPHWQHLYARPRPILWLATLLLLRPLRAPVSLPPHWQHLYARPRPILWLATLLLLRSLRAPVGLPPHWQHLYARPHPILWLATLLLLRPLRATRTLHILS